ncbi:MAG: P1 family peptidase [Hyphomonadaceae bacterium]|nr:P1 family peptidase [Hyphomonadaceae bacterium]
MSQPGNQNLITDIAGISIGNAHDPDVQTGTTVILCDEPSVGAVAVAGGGPGTRETDLLPSDKLVEQVHAVVLSGGSAYGLAAADGVAAELGAQGRGFGLVERPGVPKTPIVPAAILYDLANGGNKDWGTAPPYQDLGRAAFRQAQKGSFTLGRSGAGYGARAGRHRGGLGSASVITKDGLSVGALAAVNSFGSVYMPGTDAFWAWPFEIDGEFGGARPGTEYQADAEDWGAAKQNPQIGENTTIACIATDVALTPGQANRIAQMALAGFARAIRPVFAPFDGDAVFVLSTAKRPLPGPEALSLARLGELAANTLARAIARGVHEAQ